MILSYPDSGVFIKAWHTRHDPDFEALTYLYDPFRNLVASRFVVLETLTKAAYNRRQEEVEFYEELFALVTEWVPNDAALLERAVEIGKAFDIMNLDALHVAAAERAEVSVFATTEYPERPQYRAAQVGPVFLGDL